MTTETKRTLIEFTNQIINLNSKFLATLGEVESETDDDQQKVLIAASEKLIQAGNKILESCKN